MNGIPRRTERRTPAGFQGWRRRSRGPSWHIYALSRHRRFSGVEGRAFTIARGFRLGHCRTASVSGVLARYEAAPGLAVFSPYFWSARHEERPPPPITKAFTRRARLSRMTAKRIANPRWIYRIGNVHIFKLERDNTCYAARAVLAQSSCSGRAPPQSLLVAVPARPEGQGGARRRLNVATTGSRLAF
jgi:hypothetical protein